MTNQAEISAEASLKKRYLFLSILFDAIGMLSFSIPMIGEFSDVIWAPLAGFLMTWMYKGSVGKVAGAITFIEEAFPFSDVIPTFTLTWIYTYLINRHKNS